MKIKRNVFSFQPFLCFFDGVAVWNAEHGNCHNVSLFILFLLSRAQRALGRYFLADSASYQEAIKLTKRCGE
ncbi:hypothetical protein EM59_012800 [Vibrio parahaemolyticus]|nr:hypothetical protein [Vibrio parahaemolyticus]EGQ9143970.1 hypothetical protein [Vibrio parahaemolyticus]EGQ9585206.1 hypothetical protein [Vibrio parahaemolyticus]EGQ9979175.1 hypothetical protein [Vibrio parahaemolyticus]EGV3686443.1 hypothetical protein [Vibrio parahaemolyticus]